MKILDVQPTPNPNAIKVVVQTNLTPVGIRYLTASQNPEHPVIRALTLRTSVQDVFVQGSEITIVFDPDIAEDGKEELRWVGAQIRILDESDVLSYEPPVAHAGKPGDPMLLFIEKVLEAEILPYLRSHGGSAEVVGMDGNDVLLRYLGACGGCPASLGGTLDAIESLLQQEVEPALRVRLI